MLENVTSVDELRKVIKCDTLFENTRDLFTDQLDIEKKHSLINIMFNLNFDLI